MRVLLGLAIFLCVAMAVALLQWPPSPALAQQFPSDAISFAALLTPLVATWVMPNRRSLVIFPVCVVGMWIVAGYTGQHFIPEPPPSEGYICGLPFVATMFGAIYGLVTGVIGRAIGLSLRLKSGVATYLIQLIPFGSLLTLIFAL